MAPLWPPSRVSFRRSACITLASVRRRPALELRPALEAATCPARVTLQPLPRDSILRVLLQAFVHTRRVERALMCSRSASSARDLSPRPGACVGRHETRRPPHRTTHARLSMPTIVRVFGPSTSLIRWRESWSRRFLRNGLGSPRIRFVSGVVVKPSNKTSASALRASVRTFSAVHSPP